MAIALFLKIAGEGRTVELPRKGKLILGSSSERASVVLNGQGVSDVHCAIGRLKNGGWALKDLGSEFGTLVNGERVEATKLGEGDEVLIGSERLVIVSATNLAPPEPEKPSLEKPEPTSNTLAKPTTGSPAPRSESSKPVPAAPPTKSRSTNGESRDITIGGYRFERQLGRGGMGNVVLATQTSLDRKVALKLLKSSLAKDATFVERFRTEARAAARLNHPNIVTVFDVGEDGDHHYLSMEFMDGGSVEAQLDATGRIPWREALAILRDAAAGLVYAESRGIVHRDIKPENLMRSSEGPTKIADLGLAVQVEQEAVQAETGKIFGTPHFIAPEVVRGSAADARSDIYSLGATAYRILSGRTPFEGGSTREILRALLHEQPPRLGEIAPDVPAGVADLVHRMLAKNPDARPPSAAVCVREIDALRASEGAPLTGATDGGGGGFVKIALAGGVLIAALATGFALLGGDEAGEERDRSMAGVDDGSDPAGTNTPIGNGDRNTERETDTGNPDADPTASGETQPAEQDFESQAQSARLDLDSEQLAPADRAKRLRELSVTYAGTDTAVEAFEEARSIEADILARERETSEADAARESTLLAMHTATGLAPIGGDGPNGEGDPEAISVGGSLSALAAVPVPVELEADESLESERRALVDRVLEQGIAAAQRASKQADAAAAEGDFDGTLDALQGFLDDAQWTEENRAVAEATGAARLGELDQLVAELRTRIQGLGGRKDEFAAERLAQERIDVGRILGDHLATELRAMNFASAGERVRKAATIIQNDRLRAATSRTAANLEASAEAVDGLLKGWDKPGWRRRTILLPDGEERIEVVGVAPGALLLEKPGAAPDRRAIGEWSSSPRALQNLFFSRLERDWTTNEQRGIVTLLTNAALLRTLDLVAPALKPNGRTLSPSVPNDVMDAFAEALEWALEWADERTSDDAELAAIVERERRATRMLLDALRAKERGDWSVSATLLRRLIDEQRDTILVMLLSDGGRR